MSERPPGSPAQRARIVIMDDHDLAQAGLRSMLAQERDLTVVGERPARAHRRWRCAAAWHEAMLLVPCGGHKRTVCGPCAWAVSESLSTCRALARSYDNRTDSVPAALRQILDSAYPGGALRSRRRAA